MTEPKNSFTLFYSWQSDLDPKITTAPIRHALRAALSAVEDELGVHITLDEATRGLPGSPNIPFAIVEKVRFSDIFVGDITTVCILPDGEKSCPNPNVTFELGVASACLGWGRVIMLFNEDCANLSNLPFDFDRQRISRFKIAASDGRKSHAYKNLEILLKVAIEVIIRKAPPRPSENANHDPEALKRKRDLRIIYKFLHNMSTKLLDQHINEMPQYLYYHAPMMADSLSDLFRGNTTFFMYDVETFDAMRRLANDLLDTVGDSELYSETRHSFRQSLKHEFRMTRDDEQALTELLVKVSSLRNSLDSFISKLNDKYIEIDLIETDKEFEESYEEIKRLSKDD